MVSIRRAAVAYDIAGKGQEARPFVESKGERKRFLGKEGGGERAVY